MLKWNPGNVIFVNNTNIYEINREQCAAYNWERSGVYCRHKKDLESLVNRMVFGNTK